MDRPRISTVVSAAVASAVAFYVITRSGLAGTLGGAAVASLVYTGASHGVHRAVERLVCRGERAVDHTAEDKRPSPEPLEPSKPPAPSVLPALKRPLRRPMTRMAATWGPVLLAGAALVAALYSMTTGTPLERVVVHERVVEKPVVTERVVVQTRTVTVTQPAEGEAGQAAQGTTSTSTTLGAAAPGTAPTTSTLAAPTTTTTATAPPVPTTSPTTPAP